MKLTFLGTGTSQGVPVIGCRCAVCRSEDPRDNRLRTSAMVETGGKRLVIDAGPDFRAQMLRTGVRRIDAILLTHEHKDHTGGLDKCRELPEIALHEIDPAQPFEVQGVRIVPIAGHHSPRFGVTGYRIGELAYLTDFKTIDDREIAKLQGVEVLVVNALRFAPHDSHFNVDEALALIRRVGPREAYLTHMSHGIGLHAATDPTLPEGVRLAYDNLQTEINDPQ